MVVVVVVIERNRAVASHRQPTICQRFSKGESTAHDIDDWGREGFPLGDHITHDGVVSDNHHHLHVREHALDHLKF